MLRALALSVLCGLLSVSVSAADYAGCYERVYDAAHLKQHKLQEITRMRLSLQTSGEGEIAAGFRQAPDYLASAVQCEAEGKAMVCDILADGGSFKITPAKSGILITNTSQMRFGEEETGISFLNEAEHRQFVLRPVDCW